MDIWKAKLMNNNVKVAQGLGRTPHEALRDLEQSVNEKDQRKRRKV
ncbi:hypothetical protein [Methanofollis aquaemaris]|nr:hypothetical protein [Methanofollis aquaemaris]